MKKILLSVAFLFTLASFSYAADKKETAVNKTVDNKSVLGTNTSVVSAANYAAILEENNRLKFQTAELTSQVEDLNFQLQFSKMMFVTISNLKEVAWNNKIEDSILRIDYANMMTSTLVNLQKNIEN